MGGEKKRQFKGKKCFISLRFLSGFYNFNTTRVIGHAIQTRLHTPCMPVAPMLQTYIPLLLKTTFPEAPDTYTSMGMKLPSSLPPSVPKSLVPLGEVKGKFIWNPLT